MALARHLHGPRECQGRADRIFEGSGLGYWVLMRVVGCLGWSSSLATASGLWLPRSPGRGFHSLRAVAPPPGCGCHDLRVVLATGSVAATISGSWFPQPPGCGATASGLWLPDLRVVVSTASGLWCHSLRAVAATISGSWFPQPPGCGAVAPGFKSSVQLEDSENQKHTKSKYSIKCSKNYVLKRYNKYKTL